MKTTLLSLLLFSAISLPVCAQEEKKDAPRGDGDKREAAQRELVQAKESIQRSMKVAVEEVAALEKAERSMKAALEEAAALEKAGKLADAEARRRQADEQFQAARSELEQRTREARRNFEAHREGRDRSEAPRPEGAPPRAELENKLRHVEQAINHLKEAGLAEPAENLNQLANRLRAALKGEGDAPRRPEGDRREGEPRRPAAVPQNDIEALRREIQELRQAVRQLSEKQPR